MREELLEDIFEFIRNGASIKQSAGKGGCPITRIETIWNRTIDTERFGYADLSDDGINAYEKYLMKNGDILMSHINSPKHLGKCAIYNGQPDRLIHGMNLLSLRADQAVSFPKYLNFYFNSNYFKVQLIKISNQSVNQASFSSGKLKKLKIPLPPLDQQKKIAAILDAADIYRQKTKALITKYEELTQSLFLDMFGDPVRNPMGWEKVVFGNFITVLTDYHSNGSYETLSKHVTLKDEPDFSLMVRTTDLEKNNFIDGVKYIDEHAYNHLSKSKIYGGEIIMNKIGSAGKVYRMPQLNRAVSLGMNAFLLRFNDSINQVFLYFQLTSKYGEREIQKRVKGAVTKTIRKDAVREIPIVSPPLELQNRFADRVQAIEKQKAQAQGSLVQAEDLFNSLLQKAFKGELV